MTVSLERPTKPARRRPSPHPRRPRTVQRSARNKIAWPVAVIIVITMLIMFTFAMLEMGGVDVRPAISAAVDLLEKMR